MCILAAYGRKRKWTSLIVVINLLRELGNGSKRFLSYILMLDGPVHVGVSQATAVWWWWRLSRLLGLVLLFTGQIDCGWLTPRKEICVFITT